MHMHRRVEIRTGLYRYVAIDSEQFYVGNNAVDDDGDALVPALDPEP